MKKFFDKVAGRLDKLDIAGVSRQYRLLAREAGFLEDVLGALEEGVVVSDGAGTLLYANAAAGAMLGFDPEKMRGKDAALALSPLGSGNAPPHDGAADPSLGESDASYDAAPSIARCGSGASYDARPSIGRSGGMHRAILRQCVVAYPVRRTVEVREIVRESGNSITILRDVTDLKAQEAQAIDESRTEAVRELASGIAHEIGNPLNALSLNLQLFARTLQGVADEGLRESLLADAEAMKGEIARLDGIVKKFLQAMRPVRPELAPGSVATPLNEMLGTMKSLFETHRVKVTVTLPPALPPVMLDSAQMAQVFFNLAKNALEAMKDGGELEIAVAAEDETVAVSFRDTGCGMAPERLGRIFSAGRTTKATGSGLGLMLSQRIVRAHGGEIEVASREGEGTVFTVRLPRIAKRIRELG